MSKHTPGPWTYEPAWDVPGHKECAGINTGKGRFVSEWAYRSDYDEFERTAMLITAAPDLLAALEELCDEIGDCRLTENARAAIEKATRKCPPRTVTD